jgi:hypothetical protein
VLISAIARLPGASLIRGAATPHAGQLDQPGWQSLTASPSPGGLPVGRTTAVEVAQEALPRSSEDSARQRLIESAPPGAVPERRARGEPESALCCGHVSAQLPVNTVDRRRSVGRTVEASRLAPQAADLHRRGDFRRAAPLARSNRATHGAPAWSHAARAPHADEGDSGGLRPGRCTNRTARSGGDGLVYHEPQPRTEAMEARRVSLSCGLPTGGGDTVGAGELAGKHTSAEPRGAVGVARSTVCRAIDRAAQATPESGMAATVPA